MLTVPAQLACTELLATTSLVLLLAATTQLNSKRTCLPCGTGLFGMLLLKS